MTQPSNCWPKDHWLMRLRKSPACQLANSETRWLFVGVHTRVRAGLQCREVDRITRAKHGITLS
jgi:hypothetical protein